MTSAEQIKARLDVTTLVGSYLKLEKSGVNLKARCPFHNEKTASFYVSPQRDIWHCFGCGKGGDIFKFVMEIDGVEFPDALRVLADRVGIELKQENSYEHSKRSKLLQAMEEATTFFTNNLEASDEAKKYVESRGVNAESLKKYRIGFAPDSWRALSEHLKRKGFTDAELNGAGLTATGSRGPYDRFRDRIIFPLQDSLGRVIGFAGRILHETEKSGGKYVNSPQTALYDKSRYLYGFSFAKEAIRREKKIVMVEGNLDLILSQQAGVHNTVAVSGTALTEAHVKQLRRLSESVMFAFDIDAAGIEATRRAMDLAHNADLQVSIVDIKGGKDPADIVKSSPDKWIKLVAGAIGSIDFFHKKALDKYMLNDPTEKKKFGVEMLNLLAPHPNEIFKAHWIRVFSKDLNIGEEALWRELDKVKIGEAPQFMEEKEVERKEQSRKERLEERIAGLLLLNPSYASLGDMPTRSECSLASTGVLFESLPKRARSVTVDKFLEALPADVAQLATRLIFEAEIATGDMPDVETEFLDMIHSWRELAIKDKLLLLKREIEDLEKRGDKESARAHMKEFHALTTSLAHVISNHSYHNEKIHKREA